jgi:hypothetical protein
MPNNKQNLKNIAPQSGQVTDFVIDQQCCGTCEYRNITDDSCNAPVLYSDSTYCRGGYFRKKMNREDGRNCPTYKAI